MAVYKVIQDVEAEDKIVGPLTLKQFVFGAIAIGLAFINFKVLISYDLGVARVVLLFFFGLPMVLFGILAVPFGADQPTELWIMSHLHFLFSARKRLWSQDGAVQNVTITAPKAPPALTKDISQGEVKSRLKALADLLDSRGWSAASTPAYQSPIESAEDSDRLVSSETLTTPEPIADIKAGDDVFEEQSSPTAQRFGSLVKEAEESMKKELAKKLSQASSKPEPEEPVSQPSWGVEGISPQSAITIKPDLPTELQFPVSGDLEPIKVNGQELSQRLSAAEASLHTKHPIFAPASPLTAERQRRAQKRLLASQAKQNLVDSGNFSISTLSSLANASDEQQIKSMPI